MKTTILIAILIAAALVYSGAFADTADPVFDYKNTKGLTTSDILYRWAADVDGDGKTDIFLCLKESYEEDARDKQAPSWRIYFSVAGGNTYFKPAGIDDGDPKGLGYSFPKIDPNSVFVGQITQLNKRGIVTIQTDTSRGGPAVARIYAYTRDGNNLKETTLVEYDPSQSNAIYEQYLSNNRRTQVQLQEVTP